MQKFLNVFAVIITLLIMSFFWLVIQKIGTADQYSHDVMLTLVGTLSGAMMTIIGFYFGSSKSSTDKNDVIRRMLEAAGAQPPTGSPTAGPPAGSDAT